MLLEIHNEVPLTLVQGHGLYINDFAAHIDQWLVEMMPEMFVEMSQELAADKGIANGDTVVVESARGSITAKAIVTIRLKPAQVNGTTVHYISLPWNWGYMGLSKGDSANLLSPRIGDPNTGIPEFRAFLCNIRRA